MAAPVQHDPNLPHDIQPLFDAYPQALADKMQAAVGKVSELKAQGKRVLIIVREDATVTKLNEMMRSNQINSHEVVTSWPKPVVKGLITGTTDTIDAIDNAIDAIDALITTFTVLNIHGRDFRWVCDRGIMLETPDSVETHSHTRNVPLRDGNEPFNWDVWYVPGSLDSWRDLAMAKRKVTTMLADQTYPELGAFVDLHRIVCFYDVAVTMMRVESQYPRDRVHWSRIEAEEIKREGLFYFALGKFVKENPDVASRIDALRVMRSIAKS